MNFIRYLVVLTYFLPNKYVIAWEHLLHVGGEMTNEKEKLKSPFFSCRRNYTQSSSWDDEADRQKNVVC